MREQNTEIIVINRYSINEYDKELHALTKDFGKLIIKVQGVRKGSGKLKAMTEPFTYSVAMLYYPQKSIVAKLLTGVLNKVFEVSYKKLRHFLILQSFFEKYIPFGISEKSVFELFLNSLYDITKDRFNEANFINVCFRIVGVESGCRECGRIDIFMYLCYPGLYCSNHRKSFGVKVYAEDFLKYRKYL
ncbi:MAG: DNA repair protein RecO [bacterium]|nr:DNA repair protein RecO [bacterium]